MATNPDEGSDVLLSRKLTAAAVLSVFVTSVFVGVLLSLSPVVAPEPAELGLEMVFILAASMALWYSLLSLVNLIYSVSFDKETHDTYGLVGGIFLAFAMWQNAALTEAYLGNGAVPWGIGDAVVHLGALTVGIVLVGLDRLR